MDSKITLSFDKSVIQKAKKFAEENNISLSRLTEFLLGKVVNSSYKSIDQIPVSDWIAKVSEGEVTYTRSSRSRKTMKKEYYSKKMLK
jgi:hypothetical protein